MANWAGVMLFQDKVGYKYDDVVKHKISGSPQCSVDITRGELLKDYHHEEKKYNYVLQRDPSVFLKCAYDDVAVLFTQEEFMLMEGIEKPVERLNAFTEGMIDFGLSLEPDSRVFVNTGKKEKKLIRGTVHYIGEVQGYQGFQFGVELKEKIEGGHNGTVSGHSYFHCEDGYGKFVPLNRLVKYYSSQSSSASQEPGKSLSTSSKRDSNSHSDGSFKNTHSKSNLDSHQSPLACKNGDRVCFSSKQGQLSEGTVKWVGTSSMSRNFECVYVGILTDNEVFATDYEKSVPGLGHLILAPKLKGLFIPESMVKKIDQNKSKRNMEKSKATKSAEDHPKQDVLSEQQKCSDVTIGSLVQLPNAGGGAGIYGIVRWIGTIPNVTGLVAGIELDEYMDGCTNGCWEDQKRKSHQFFTCEDGKGLYYPVNHLIMHEKASKQVQGYCEKTTLTESHVNHLEISLKEKENTISELIGEVKHQKEKLAKAKHSYEAKLQEKEEQLLKKEDEIAGHLQVIASKEKEGKNFQLNIEKLNEKLEAYENMHDISWIQISQDSVPSWKIDRSVLKRIPKTYLGVGAWGVVYSAEFKGEQVAIKHAHRELLNVQSTVQMVKREISILAHIHHPNLVRFIGAVVDHDVESKRDVPIIVLELLDMNLRTAYANESLGQATMASIFCDVAYALHYLHEQTTPIIHRDVSSPNILLKKLPNHFYRAKVSDFGSANLARQSITAGAGAIIYTAPEMFPQEDVMAEPPEQTVKVDVYSFGIVMLEVVCREMPVPEKRRALLLRCESRWKVIYDLVRQCTRIPPHDRPTMREILQYICRI